jgi:hypothetical protein
MKRPTLTHSIFIRGLIPVFLLLGAVVPGSANSLNHRSQPAYRIMFGGDTSFGENYQAWLERHGRVNILRTRGYDYCLEKLAPLLKKADLAIVNLETPLVSGRRSELAATKKYIHWGDGHKTPQILKNYNIRNVALANNHTMDFGLNGLRQTLNDLAKGGLNWFGAGLNEEAAAEPYHSNIEFGAKSLSLNVVAGFEYHYSYDKKYNFYAAGSKGGVNAWEKTAAARQIQDIRMRIPEAFIVAFPHWGENYAGRTIAQKELGRVMVDAGADLVIGHGAHILQEIEFYKGKWIIYGLGNFVFNSPGRFQKRNVKPYSMAAMLNIREFENHFAVNLHLYPIFSDNLITRYQPHPVAAESVREIRALLRGGQVDASQTAQPLVPSLNEIGWHFKIDLQSPPGRD